MTINRNAQSQETLRSGATDGNGLTAGDFVKVVISGAIVFTPYGWAYAAVDLV